MSDPLALQVIDSRRLLYFYHVAKNGSVSRAEAATLVPQPVISRHIHKLEEELGLQLLNRHGRGVTLTQFGKILFDHAETILNEMEATIEELELARRHPAGRIRIAAPATVMSLYMPEIIKRFMKDLPEIELVVMQALTGEIYELLASDKIDVGLIMQVPNKVKFEAKKLSVEPMVCVASRNHPIAKKKSVSRKVLADYRMVLPSMSHGLRAVINRYMAAGNINISAHLQVDSIPLIRAVLSEGEFVSILPDSTCRLEFDPKLFATVPITPRFTRELYAAYLTSEKRPPYVENLIKHIQAVFRERASQPRTPPLAEKAVIL